MKTIFPAALLLAVLFTQAASLASRPPPAKATDFWSLARARSGDHRFSTLFTAQDVRGRLANGSGLAACEHFGRQRS